MTLPEQFHNRWCFAITALLGVVLVFVALYCFLALMSKSDGQEFLLRGKSLFVSVIAVSVSASASAMICWPTKTSRTLMRMFVAGLMTVLLAFIFTAILVAIGSGITSVSDFLNILTVIVIFGSAITLGIPYLIGMLLSQLFVDNETYMQSKG